MDQERVRELLERVGQGDLSVEAALDELRVLPFSELTFAKVDSHRPMRCGFPEVIFCQGKTPGEVARIATVLLGQSDRLLATRAGERDFAAVLEIDQRAVYHDKARCITVTPEAHEPPRGKVLVVSAGTSDLPVAEEARVTAEIMGSRVETIYDAGVAGIHRLLHQTRKLMSASAIVVVAGMEGALASVVGGLVAVPVVAVPTSIGYGASFGGLAPLLTMLNSCAAGVAVVNIDNGFGAGYLAAVINRRTTPATQEIAEE